MIALDTNIVVRLLVNDDERQSRQAYRLVSSHPVFVTLAVLMETEWVLRRVYGFSRSQIVEGLRGLVGLEQFSLDDPAGVKRVLEAFEAGLDFADAVHLAQAQSAKSFATFDTSLVRKAGQITGLIPVSTPASLVGGR